MPQIQDPRSLAYTPGATAEDSGIPLWLRPVSNWWEEQQRKLREWQQQQYEMEMERARIAQNVGQSNLDYLNSGQNPAKPPQSPVTIAANAFGENIYSPYSPTGKGTIIPYTTPDGTFVPRDVLGAERFNRPQPPVPPPPNPVVEDFMQYGPSMKSAPYVAPEDRGWLQAPLRELQQSISGPIAQVSPEGERLAKLYTQQFPESNLSQRYWESQKAAGESTIEAKESGRVLQGYLSTEDQAAQNRRFVDFLGPQNTIADNAQVLWDTASTVAPIVSGQMPGAAKAIAETQGPLAATLTNFLGTGMPDEQAAAKGVIHLAGEFIAKQGKKALGINPVGKTLIKLLQTPGYTLERALSETFASHPDATVSDVARVLHVTDADSLNYIDAFKNVSTWDETRRAGQGVPSAAEIIARQTPPTQTAPTGVVPPVVPPTATGAQLIPENRPSWATRGKESISNQNTLVRAIQLLSEGVSRQDVVKQLKYGRTKMLGGGDKLPNTILREAERLLEENPVGMKEWMRAVNEKGVNGRLDDTVDSAGKTIKGKSVQQLFSELYPKKKQENLSRSTAQAVRILQKNNGDVAATKKEMSKFMGYNQQTINTAIKDAQSRIRKNPYKTTEQTNKLLQSTYIREANDTIAIAKKSTKPIPSAPIHTPEQVGEIMKSASADGGVTYNFSNGEGNLGGKSYHSVGIFKNTTPIRALQVTPEGFNTSVLDKYLADNADILRNPHFSLGVWDNSAKDGKIYLDIVATPDNETAVHAIGTAFQQKEGFNLKTFTSYEINHGKNQAIVDYDKITNAPVYGPRTALNGTLKPETFDKLDLPEVSIADNWYPEVIDYARKIYGKNWDKALAAFAATSPHTMVKANYTQMEKAINQWLAGLEMKGFSPSHLPNLERVLGDEEIHGRKVWSFLQNLIGNYDPVTVDVWMMRAFGFDHDAPTKAEYDFIEGAVKKMAAERNTKPAFLQARIWGAERGSSEGIGSIMAKGRQLSMEVGLDKLAQVKEAVLATPEELQTLAAKLGIPPSKDTEALRNSVIDSLQGKNWYKESAPGTDVQGMGLVSGSGQGKSQIPYNVAREQWATHINEDKKFHLDWFVRNAEGEQKTRAQEMVDFVYRYASMIDPRFDVNANAMEVAKVAMDLRRRIKAHLADPTWKVNYKTDVGANLIKVVKMLENEHPYGKIAGIDEFVRVAHQFEPSVVRQVFGVDQPPRTRDISGTLVNVFNYLASPETSYFINPKAVSFAEEGNPELAKYMDMMREERGKGGDRPQSARGKGQMSSLVPEQPEQPAGRYTRPPMGRPPWEEGPVAAAAQAPAPEPPVGATTLPQQNAPLEAPQRPLPPLGGRTVPPAPETANLEMPEWRKSKNFEGIDETTLGTLDSIRNKILGALSEARGYLKLTKEMRSDELSKRVAAAENELARKIDSGEPLNAFESSTSALKGVLPTGGLPLPANQITTEEMTAMIQTINSGKMRYFDKLNLYTALRNLADGTPLQEAQISRLAKFFGIETERMAKNRSLLNMISDIVNLPKSLQSSMDLSAPLRQGLALASTKEWRGAWGPMLKSFASEKAIVAAEEAIVSNKYFGMSRDAGLDLTTMTPHGPLAGGMTKLEEAFPSRLPARLGEAIEKSKIPEGLKKAISFLGVRPSERAYDTFLNKLRMDSFANTVQKFEELGQALSVDDMSKLASFLNVATGRGDLSQRGKIISSFFNIAFFSPQLQVSRFKLPVNYFKMPPQLRKEYAGTLLKTYGTIAGLVSMVGLGAAAGLFGKDISVEPNPISSDFAKIKVGNQRIDPWGGNQQWATFFSRLISGMYKSTTTGKISSQNRLDLVIRMIRTKLSPSLGFVTDALSGHTLVGEDMTLGNTWEIAKNRLMPMFINDMIDAVQIEGARGGLLTLPGAFGIGTQTYIPSTKKEAATLTGALKNVPVKEPTPEAKARSDAKAYLAQTYDLIDSTRWSQAESLVPGIRAESERQAKLKASGTPAEKTAANNWFQYTDQGKIALKARQDIANAKINMRKEYPKVGAAYDLIYK